MADEITHTTGLAATKGNLAVPKVGGTKKITMTGSAGAGSAGPGVINATTAANGIEVTPIPTSPGLAWMKNLDTVNFCTFGVLTGGAYVPLGKLLPGEEATFRLDSATIPGTNKFHVKGDSATVPVHILVLPN